jgi:hypothetical protein
MKKQFFVGYKSRQREALLRGVEKIKIFKKRKKGPKKCKISH